MIDLWGEKSERLRIEILMLVVILILYYFIASLFILDVFGFFFTVSVIMLGVAKFYERIYFVSSITDGKVIRSFQVMFLLLFLEYLSVVLIYFNFSVNARYFVPGLVSLLLIVKVLGKQKKSVKTINYSKVVKGYFSISNAKLIIYILLLTIFSTIDRYLAKYVLNDHFLAEYLLVFSYALSCQTLFNAVVDATRQKIIAERSLKSLILCFIVLLSIYLFVLIAGYYILLSLKFIPLNFFLIWLLLLSINLLCGFLNFLQIIELHKKKLGGIICYWVLLSSFKLALFYYASKNNVKIEVILFLVLLSLFAVFLVKLFRWNIDNERNCISCKPI